MGDVRSDDVGREKRAPRRYLPDIMFRPVTLTGFKEERPVSAASEPADAKPPTNEGATAGVLGKAFLLLTEPLGALGSTFLGSRLQRVPGYSLLWFADFFYSKKSVEECLRPTIQDLQDEYTEALAAGRPHKARWVRIRGTWSFVCAAGLLTVASVGKQVVKIWKMVG